MFKSDARRYRRMSLNLPARIVVNAVDEYQGRLLNISPGDMALITDAKVVIGDAAVITIEGLAVKAPPRLADRAAYVARQS